MMLLKLHLMIHNSLSLYTELLETFIESGEGMRFGVVCDLQLYIYIFSFFIRVSKL